MKKFLTILLSLLLVMSLAGCGKKSGGEDTPADDRIRLVYIINGTLGDKSFFDSGKEGLDWIDRDFGDKVYTEYRELTYDNSTWEQKTADIVAEGWDIVVAGTYDMKDYIGALALEYPDTKFWFFDEEWNFDDPDGWQYYNTPNLYAMLFAQNEGSFVAGAMAAMMSLEGKVAFMGGMDNTVLDDFYVGFANGAKYINPNASINCSWMNSFNDVTAGKDTATGLYEAGYDVVFACGGQAGLGGFDAVIEQPEGKWIVGVDGDQGSYFASLGTTEGTNKAARTITSMQKNVNNGFYQAMERHLNGNLPYGSNEKLGLKGEYVSVSVNEITKALFTPEQLAQVEKITADIISGAIDPGTAFGQPEGWFYGTFVPSMQ
ncbi:MAG: BMP family ABC transporter substrate-binding protein [Erysipelotrichaceae bacterium]|nr:BMP family ABC transporter substrate-binding protein [Erysipelotrichaceae bacterium]MBQ1534003.1 BMP family ABC transporter substrate-binding protein [Erysipelotrichaceae bacterium]MBQ5804273.1 BMP family ABC transporter substrate-binding protein [Erysipelotrichaceae bacterium]